MVNEKVLFFRREDAVHEPQLQEARPKSLLVRSELLIVCTFIAVSTYLIVRLAMQTGQLAESNTAHERSIVLINQQLKDHADQLQRFEQTDRQVLDSLRQVGLRNGRIETRLAQIENEHIALKRADARMLQQEQKLREQLNVLNSRTVQNASSATAPSVTSSSAIPEPPLSTPADPSDHAHTYVTGLTPPKGTVVFVNQNEETWVVSKDGKEQRVHPIERIRLGFLVHNSTDGKDYILSPDGAWLGSSGN